MNFSLSRLAESTEEGQLTWEVNVVGGIAVKMGLPKRVAEDSIPKENLPGKAEDNFGWIGPPESLLVGENFLGEVARISVMVETAKRVAENLPNRTVVDGTSRSVEAFEYAGQDRGRDVREFNERRRQAEHWEGRTVCMRG